ncbi:MAG: 30S ribosomal protein S14 type Z [candidate division TM6 bacterium GW2011_GWE2_41_16]|nr:MAG: 30S ribosomal protein S14 type Z [candidate division TM6 bacterium GW2011_GWE2_41_16]
MARKALIEKNNREPKYTTQKRNRCLLCGRPRGFMRYFQTCRMCFRKLASGGTLPGVKKASW